MQIKHSAEAVYPVSVHGKAPQGGVMRFRSKVGAAAIMNESQRACATALLVSAFLISVLGCKLKERDTLRITPSVACALCG